MDEIIHYDNLTELLSPGVEMKTRIENALKKVLDDHNKKVLDDHNKMKKVLDEIFEIVFHDSKQFLHRRVETLVNLGVIHRHSQVEAVLQTLTELGMPTNKLPESSRSRIYSNQSCPNSKKTNKRPGGSQAGQGVTKRQNKNKAKQQNPSTTAIDPHQSLDNVVK